MSPQAAIKYLRHHGVDCWEDGAGTVGVVSRFVGPDGEPGKEIEFLPCALGPIRDWLGY